MPRNVRAPLATPGAIVERLQHQPGEIKTPVVATEIILRVRCAEASSKTPMRVTELEITKSVSGQSGK